MKNHIGILNSHDQLHENSCAGWGLEFILKLEGKLKIDEYPIQNKWPNGCGFGQAETNYLSAEGLICDNSELTETELDTLASNELSQDRTVIFTIPDHVRKDPNTGQDIIMTHTWAAVPTSHDHEYRSRTFGQKAPLPPLKMGSQCAHLKKVLGSHWKIHALWYK
jgi:hypothetical protein